MKTREEMISEITAIIKPHKEHNVDFIGAVRSYVSLEDWMNKCPDYHAFLEATTCAIPVEITYWDIAKYIDDNLHWENSSRNLDKMRETLLWTHYVFIGHYTQSISEWDDRVIKYIYDLIKLE